MAKWCKRCELYELADTDPNDICWDCRRQIREKKYDDDHDHPTPTKARPGPP